MWALFYWSHILKRQASPMVLHGFDVTDPIRNLADYGFTMCSTTSGINQTLYDVLGLRHQYWDICNHTVSAVEYNARFHVIDTSMSNLVTLDDGVTLASVTEAASDSARLAREHSLYATSPNGFLTGSDSGRNLTDFADPDIGNITNGYADVFCANGLKLRDYYYNWSFEMTFTADAGKAYRLWLRGKALNDSYNNDSVYVQFDGSVDAATTPIWRINTTAATPVVLEDCSGCGVAGWGWADNGYGVDSAGHSLLGQGVYFATSGPQRLRVQMREDGLGIDQIVLSAVKYLHASPGATKNDTTIVP